MKRIATLVAVLTLLTLGSAFAAPNTASAGEEWGAKSACPKCAEPFNGVEAPIGMGP